MIINRWQLCWKVFKANTRGSQKNFRFVNTGWTCHFISEREPKSSQSCCNDSNSESRMFRITRFSGIWGLIFRVWVEDVCKWNKASNHGLIFYAIILLTVYLPVFSVMFMSTSSIRTVHNEANSSPGFMMRNDGTMTDNVIIWVKKFGWIYLSTILNEVWLDSFTSRIQSLRRCKGPTSISFSLLGIKQVHLGHKTGIHSLCWPHSQQGQFRRWWWLFIMFWNICA